ncbi:MAG: hypothetical protein IPG32_07550 [Saprospirales bacterium]|nr:hypothetical protein [Saprospirales bacterium]
MTESEYTTLIGLINQFSNDAKDRSNLTILFAICSDHYALQYSLDDNGSGQLEFKGVMSNSTKVELEGVFYPARVPANNKIEQLFKASRKSLQRNFRSIQPEIFEGTFSKEVKIPQSLARKFYTIKKIPREAGRTLNGSALACSEGSIGRCKYW